MATSKENGPARLPPVGIFLEEKSSLEVPSTSSSRESGNFPADRSQPDEGGAQCLKAKLTVLGASLALFCTFGQMNAFGTFQSWYGTHQLERLPASTISWIGSLQLWVFFFSGWPIGRLFDLYGPKWLMGIGSLCYFASLMLTSICTRYYHYILAQGVLFGLGVGLLFYPSLASVSTQYSKYRATALGLAAAGSSLGGVVYPIMLERLFQKVGFGWGVRISGLVSGVGCVVATVLTSCRRSPETKPGPCFDIAALTDIRFSLLVAGSCFVALGLFIPFFYVVEYARHISTLQHMSFYVLAVMNAGGVLGRIAPAYLSDRIGRFNLLIPAAFFSGLSCIALWLGTQTTVRLLLFCAFYGFFSGAFISLVTPCVAQISDITKVGTKIGMLYTVISIPSLLGGPAAGALLARSHGSYTTTIVFSGCSTIMGSFFILASKFIMDHHVFARV